jgi:hypothetical protein
MLCKVNKVPVQFTAPMYSIVKFALFISVVLSWLMIYMVFNDNCASVKFKWLLLYILSMVWKMCGIAAYNIHFIMFRDFIIFRNCTIQHKAFGDLTSEYISYSHFLNDGRTTDQMAKCLIVSWVLMV